MSRMSELELRHARRILSIELAKARERGAIDVAALDEMEQVLGGEFARLPKGWRPLKVTPLIAVDFPAWTLRLLTGVDVIQMARDAALQDERAQLDLRKRIVKF